LAAEAVITGRRRGSGTGLLMVGTKLSATSSVASGSLAALRVVVVRVVSDVAAETVGSGAGSAMVNVAGAAGIVGGAAIGALAATAASRVAGATCVVAGAA